MPQITDTDRAGILVRVKGERGVFKVYEECLTESGAEWVTCFGGPSGHGCYRHFRPTQIVWPRTPKGSA